MNLMADPREIQFQLDIIEALTARGWVAGTAEGYDRELALYPEDLVAFVREATPDEWDKFCRMYPQDPERKLVLSVSRQLEKNGALTVLRKGYKDRGAKIQPCRFMPDHGLNEETVRQYRCNRLRVVPEVTYSPHGAPGRLDLVLFVNGIPVATMELKSEFKQHVENAIRQYKKDRPPKDPKTRMPEPLLTFKRGALVHFAVSQHEVFMCTRLAGEKSFFLPFNKGTEDGGKGNPSIPGKYDTAYLWEEVLAPDNMLRILGRFLHLQKEEKEDIQGRKYIKETLIFPRFHQWDAVNKLIDAAREEGPGHRYLIQHSAGSGKSNSIAWTAHQLASLYDARDEKVFDSVIVITDRTILNDQLQETIYQFEHAEGMIARISREIGDGTKSEQLAKALETTARIIIVTIQTFPFVLDMLRERTSLQGRHFAVIADEAHSSQTGLTARKLREVLNVEQVDEDEELTAEDMLDLALEARKPSPNISYFAFTATPKPKTLELFGRLPEPELPPSDTNIPEAFHVYSMRQAIEEGFILDVLKNYTTYKMACRLALMDGAEDQEVEKRKGAASIAKWVRLHDYNISQKVAVIVEHFRTRVAPLLGGHAKAMAVTDSRKAAVRYKLAFDKYIREHPECEGIQAMVAFSGDVNDPDSGPEPFNETNMNPGLNGRDLRTAFDTDEYQVMIVANKFQTGFDQPKLCAMYVDKRLKGVDAVQTLSRLNRTHPGKDKTFVLDFVNDPDEILEAFRPFYKTAALEDVSDPNLAYDLKDALDEQRIYDVAEVEAFVRVFFDKTASQAALLEQCRPAVERYKARRKEVMDVLHDAEEAARIAKANNDPIAQKNAERSVKEAREAKDALEHFKKDLRSFIRFYEFSSQIIEYGDREMESLAIYGRHLLPLLRDEQLDEEIDLSDVEMTHYRLSKQQEISIRLGEGDEDDKLKPTGALGSRFAKERQTESLSEIVERMNELFNGEFTEDDALNYARTIADKLRENTRVMEQLQRNTPEQAMLGDFPNAVDNAVIESMETHSSLAKQYLSDERVKNGFARLLMDLLLKSGLESQPTQSP
ncbi:type I restriction endonuclease subunit R [Oceanidesulfovibrio indonesiensis]|uniref:Type I restriction endonuclease subunit R n=2 Tax=Oceanidesulfovibrio indonesiensis TaxID=54767 RepID=A0A7M3ME49_9BACT|nr:type I restriction endonuclease subunit R [Oceanidesulfovibrio indonesiensis]